MKWKEMKGKGKNTAIEGKEGNSKCDNQTINVAPWVEKIEVFKTG